jgi:HAD superfamily hydrolase (TIGR01549 family)
MTLKINSDKAFLEPPVAVLFDADNTLYPYRPAHDAAMKDVGAKVAHLLSVSPDEFESAFDAARRQVKDRLGETASSHSRLLYFQRMLELLGLKSQPLMALDFEQTYWRTFLRSVDLFDDVREYLDDLRIHGIPTALVTDLTAQIQFRKLVYFGLEHAFDFVVTSEETGVDKPHAAPFKLAMEKLEISTGPVWMIGDNPKADIQGARDAIGAATLFKRHDPDPKGLSDAAPDLIFDNFADLRRFTQGLIRQT